MPRLLRSCVDDVGNQSHVAKVKREPKSCCKGHELPESHDFDLVMSCQSQVLPTKVKTVQERVHLHFLPH